MPEPRDRIFLRGLNFHARHGVLAEEHVLGQRFEVDVDCMLDVTTYSTRDDYASALCYQTIFDVVKDVVEGPRVGLIEALAESIAAALVARFAAIERVRVEVRKPAAPIQGVFGTVGVEIHRGRG